MSLEQIGQKLKTARDSLGLSLSQIAERTKIPFNHLQALDNGHADNLPESVYVSGFIKRYAECVGLNGQQLADQYKEEIEGNTPVDNPLNFLARGVKAQPSVIPSQQAYVNRSRLEQQPPNLLKSVPFYALWIIIALGLFVFLASRQQNIDIAQQDPSVLALKDSTQQFTPVPEKPSTSSPGAEIESVTEKRADNDARIVLSASQHVWVEVKSVGTGDVKYTGFLESGDQRAFQDPEGLRVRAGNGGSLSVEMQGKVQTFGSPGKKSERTFLAKGTGAETTEQADSGANSANQTARSAAIVAPPAKKPPPVKKVVASAKDKELQSRRADSLQNRPYLPGESLGSSTKAIDVPYRFSE